MIYEIDQSGKVEDTSKDTVICIANKQKQYVILLPRHEKRRLQSYFREKGEIRNFVIIVFSILIAHTIRKMHASAVVIDREYYGREKTIKKIIYMFLGDYRADLSFDLIGKKSPAR
jgi:hypothetical protein